MYYYTGKDRNKRSRYLYVDRVSEPAPTEPLSTENVIGADEDTNATIDCQAQEISDTMIVRITPCEWKLFKELRLRCLSDSPDAFGTTFEEAKLQTDNYWEQRILNEKVAHFIAFRKTSGDTGNGIPVGIAVGAPSNHSDNAKRDSAGLFSMWVASEDRGQGVGKAIVEAVKVWARGEQVYKRLVLDVCDANIAAIALYRSCGFVPTGVTGTMSAHRDHITVHELAVEL
jgi:RimJ/RimL family protein N-acetyltransferase